MGVNLHYTVKGVGDTIVFLHGMAGSSRYWDTVVRSLPLTNIRVVQIDLLGFGLSPKPHTIVYGYDEHLAAITDVLNRLGLQEFTLVGHSMGALLALRLSTMKTFKINRLILISMPYYVSPAAARAAITRNSWVWRAVLYGKSSQFLCNLWCSRLRPVTKHIAPLYLKNFPKVAAQDSLLHTWQSYDESLRNIIEQQNVKFALELLTVPVVVAYGSEDQSYPGFKHLIETLEHTSCTVKVAKGADHHIPISHPEFLVSLIK